MVYYSFFHSGMTFGIIFCCRNLFKNLEILPLKAQYIFSLHLLVVNNKDLFMTNSENHTRQSKNFCLSLANLTIYQQGIHYSSIKHFNKLPLEIKNIAGNPNKFKQVLRKFLITNSFNTLKEFYTT
jgi:hypothetical protein